MTALLQLDKVFRTYRSGAIEVQALRGVDLRIEPGEFVALVGRSGSGKSTLLHILGCLDQPTAGRYLLNGEDISRLPDEELSQVRCRTIGFVFQAFHLLKGLTVLDNVALPMKYGKVPAGERSARAAELLERVGLGHRLLHRPNELSGGERQRVAIARALANRPAVVLADEPTGNLDSEAQRVILGLFEALQRDMGLTLVMVTHDALVARLARRSVRLLDGRVVDEGAGS